MMEDKIEREGDELVIRIPLTQKESNCYKEDKDLCDVDNLVGVIAGDFEQGFYQLIDLSYKGDQQLGSPILMTDMDDDVFRKLCIKLGITVWEYEKCAKCGSTIWGGCTWDKGPVCWDCENK